MWKEFRVTQADIERIAAAEQRSPEWHAARKWRLTGSNFAAALGHNPYTTPEQLVDNMLHGGFTGNEATQWGCDHEDEACAAYEAHMRTQFPDFAVRHTGLQIVYDYPFLGVSPDGLCSYWDPDAGVRRQLLLEIKCPYRWRPGSFYKDTVPHYYYDQVQGCMGFLDLPAADFVVWTPVGMQVNRILFDAEYFEGVLRPGLIDFYERLFYPALIAERSALQTK